MSGQLDRICAATERAIEAEADRQMPTSGCARELVMRAEAERQCQYLPGIRWVVEKSDVTGRHHVAVWYEADDDPRDVW